MLAVTATGRGGASGVPGMVLVGRGGSSCALSMKEAEIYIMLHEIK